MDVSKNGSQIRLDAGTPVVIVGFSSDDLTNPHNLPWIVLAGRLVEPYAPGQAFLLAKSPMSGSVGPKEVEELASYMLASGARLFSLLRKRPDERGAIAYWILEDKRNSVVPIEQARQPEWPWPLCFAQALRNQVLMAREEAHLAGKFTLHIPGTLAYGNASRSAATLVRKRLTLTRSRYA